MKSSTDFMTIDGLVFRHIQGSEESHYELTILSKEKDGTIHYRKPNQEESKKALFGMVNGNLHLIGYETALRILNDPTYTLKDDEKQ